MTSDNDNNYDYANKGNGDRHNDYVLRIQYVLV